MQGARKHFVVMLGASAGGLEAIQEFFDHMPTCDNMSFVIIQHLSPDYKSLLVELVGRRTRMKVVEAAQHMPMRRNCIYVIPNNKLIRLERNKLQLSEKVHDKLPNNAIDVFLHSLAADRKKQAIAVILSGTGTDGTKGIGSIKEEGGLVMVQDPSTARFDGMPNTAIASGFADVVDSPAGLANAVVQATQEADGGQEINEPDDQLLSRIFELIRQHSGQNFHYYKTPTILRRIHKKMFQLNFKEPQEYVQYLESHPEECQQLAQEFLINVTRFFRDADAFQIIREQVIPSLLEGKADGEQLKVWVAACSTGEEAYSIAICLDEAQERTGKRVDVKIFASDIDASNLDIASVGLYAKDIEQDVPAPLLEKYFTRKSKGYQIVQRIRKQIVFARHDISHDPPFIRNDLVCCRNMLIYMNSILQERIYSILQFSTMRYGYLFLGPSENPPFGKNAAIQQLSLKWKIFRKLADTKHRIAFNDPAPVTARSGRDGTLPVADRSFESKLQKELWTDLRQALTDDMGMVAFYIDRNFEVHQTLGNYESLLSLPKKTLTLNLVRMLPQDLAMVLNREVRKAWKAEAVVSVDSIVFGRKEEPRAVHALIKPPAAASPHDHTLVMLTRAQVPAMENGHQLSAAPAGQPDMANLDYVSNLESELAETRSSLNLAVEDLETANEELQSSNEELLSSNEELQSSNEELQSLNEELYTLNTEHQQKIRELVELNDDLNNYFRSTEIAQIFLDVQLRIRKFNPASTQIINFIETDLGRPMAHISGNLKYERLMQDIHEVQHSRQQIEKEVELDKGRNFLLRIMPYITREGKYAGIIITFVDITTITNLNNIIRSVFNATSSAIFALRAISDPPGTITDFFVQAANARAEELFGEPGKSMTGKKLKEEIPLLAGNELFRDYLSVVQDNAILHRDAYFNSRDEWFELTAVKMPEGLVVTFTNITDKRKSVEKIRRSYSELNEAKENLKRLNTELEDKVKERTRELSFSEERFRLVAQATNDALWDWDLTRDKVWRSDSFQKLFGYPQTDMSRQEMLGYVHKDDRQAMDRSLHSAIHDNHNQWSREYRFRKADGQYAYVLDRGYILRNEFGVPYRMLGSMLDLSDLHHLEEINQALESSNHDLQLFASVASHDLQEPLRKIHMFSKMVKDRHTDTLPGDTLLLLDKVMHSAVRMKALVTNILHFSKLSANSGSVEKTDLEQVIRDVVEDFELTIREKKAEIITGDIPHLLVNRSYIQQVFQNLISNALKFSRKDIPPRISITAWKVGERAFDAPRDEKGKWCRIEVRDNGIGFEEQYRSRIFDLFQRLNSKDKYEGTGIGLAIVKKIIEKHNGIITADSHEDSGALFVMVLPA
ncbi:MAG: chemotaxis protein CheB [Candidatus Pseudobacter hemicellulosilyticus]|uniref:Chemotaxis protein CheB n=1 Tax=Candidatus Pseudobacter hemicellulosilyticus TaxID=3121375 RepID=A0AAJ6BGD5_9BACT|nr:MAG: chemotaxis protein CheB [Pseudobacter sp.]